MTDGVKRVLVLWADRHSPNFGVRVLADGMAALARSAWGSAIEVDMQNFGKGESNVSFGTRAILRDMGRRSGLIKQKLKDYDVILDSGAGDSFADIYGLKRFAFMVYAQRAAFNLDIPMAMGPQTIGPFNTRIGRWAARRSLRAMDVVIARDAQSADFASVLGRKVDALSTDVVFALDEPSRGEPRDIILNLSGLLWFEDSHVNSSRYRAEVIQLVDGLQCAGRRVTLLAHVVNSVRGHDDVDAIQAFKRETRLDLETVVPTTLEEVRSTVAGANLVIGSRMHACLNALSVGTPSIAWAYSRKFAPLMNDLGWKFVVDLADPTSTPASQTLALVASMSNRQFKDLVTIARKNARERLRVSISALSAVGS